MNSVENVRHVASVSPDNSYDADNVAASNIYQSPTGHKDRHIYSQLD